MPVSTINAPMTSATARYADSLRLSVAPMMDWADSVAAQGFHG
jgi:tRNA-dihydrouridine synthase A